MNGRAFVKSGGCMNELSDFLNVAEFTQLQGLNKDNYRMIAGRTRHMFHRLERTNRRTFIWTSPLHIYVLRVWQNNNPRSRVEVPFFYKAARLENPFVIYDSIQVGEALYAYVHTKPTRFHTDQ